MDSLNARQARTNEKIRLNNERQNRILTNTIYERHGIKSTKDSALRVVDSEMRVIQREFQEMRSSQRGRTTRTWLISEKPTAILRCNSPAVLTEKTKANQKHRKSKTVLPLKSSSINLDKKVCEPISFDNHKSTQETELVKSTKTNDQSQEYKTIAMFTTHLRNEKNLLKAPLDINHAFRESSITKRSVEPLVNNTPSDPADHTRNSETDVEFVKEKYLSYESNLKTSSNITLKHPRSPDYTTVKSSLPLSVSTYYNLNDQVSKSPSTPLKRSEKDVIEGSPLVYDSKTRDVPNFRSTDLVASAGTHRQLISSIMSSDAGSTVGESTSDLNENLKPSLVRRSSSNKIKVTDILRQAKFDRERYNPDGSVRTVHKLPDFTKSYEQARRARYIRSKELLEREKELSTKQIFHGHNEPPNSSSNS